MVMAREAMTKAPTSPDNASVVCDFAELGEEGAAASKPVEGDAEEFGSEEEAEAEGEDESPTMTWDWGRTVLASRVWVSIAPEPIMIIYTEGSVSFLSSDRDRG